MGYNKDVVLGISHWGPKCQLFYRSQLNRLSKHNVYSTVKILSVVRVKVDKQFGYGYLEEIMVRIADRQLLRNFRLGYNKGVPNKKRSAKDQRRSNIMVKLIEEQCWKGGLCRIWKRLVGARELKMDYRLTQRTE
ncbi:hypothetical protein Tco_0023545 [Tanacetum coccineum]